MSNITGTHWRPDSPTDVETTVEMAHQYHFAARVAYHAGQNYLAWTKIGWRIAFSVCGFNLAIALWNVWNLL